MKIEENHYGSDYTFIPAISVAHGTGTEILPDLYCYTVQIVNICLIGLPNAADFILVDAGMPRSADEIIAAAEKRFGSNSRPKAIILTHGHFDHVGAVIELIRYWRIPVYAHPAELPYLTGKKSYPAPDSSVEGGMIAKVSALFPNEPIDLGSSVQPLPSGGMVPHLPEFRWIHTPGHTPGHISLFREKDRALIAGDAFVTVRQDQLFKVLTQKLEFSGPPRYFTNDWEKAKESVRKLATLHPKVAVTGHGKPVTGEQLRAGLIQLVRDFDHIAVPDYGKYIQ
ncbi:MBL fold metallo-hydrolase [Anoxybacteroides rupiense]|uniref:MBL fold metallo-hydrolase n=1 Tax=Anoxybacteroides rupiense TaxID=311460 RepID=A0ABD5IV69_9BACL|nr:MBL fold metallo-hydrolase [Anoxybacillus rupiensis]MED5051670.1 MBL fold metallo-hydrolase [Anoxybacillus rupiensis]